MLLQVYIDIAWRHKVNIHSANFHRTHICNKENQFMTNVYCDLLPPFESLPPDIQELLGDHNGYDFFLLSWISPEV